MITTVKIGNLCLRLESSRKVFNHQVGSLSAFVAADLDEVSTAGKNHRVPLLSLKESGEVPGPEQGRLLIHNETWELREALVGDFVFSFKQYDQRCFTIQVDPSFEQGWISYKLITPPIQETTCVDVLNIRLYLNWLANFGDLMLHASGFVYEGKGYCFLGESLKGKSTLLRDLVGTPGLTPLGEDQVILRYLDGQFRVFGTPWHTDASICSPLDAPLEKLFLLDRTRTETLERMGPLEVASRVLQTAFVPYYRAERMPLILERVGLLAEQVPAFWLSYKLGQDGLDTILNA